MNKNSLFFINFLAAYISSFLLIKFIIFYTINAVSVFFDIETTHRNFDIICTTNGYSDKWNHLSVLTIYSTEIITLLVLTSLFRFSYHEINKRRNFAANVFFNIAYITSINLLFAAIVAGIFTKSAFFHFINWLYFPEWLGYVLAGVAIIANFIFGYYSIPRFIYLASSKRIAYKTSLQKQFLQIAFPGVIVVFILYLIALHFYDVRIYDLWVYFVFIVFSLPGFIRKKVAINPDELELSKVYVSRNLIILASIFTLIYVMLKFIY